MMELIGKSKKEKEADALASELLIPEKEWAESKLTRVPHPERVEELATRVHVHTAIVAGRVRYEKKNYKILSSLVGNRLLRKQFPAFKTGY
ncbi:MAG: hypothetical protein PF904_05730 [Kiritimatiellae bacterium]|jgi:HTH-type transcriptional regulator/antitoxin HigA|nr:hypothetical protein [Kiritimatiellia bacterium]